MANEIAPATEQHVRRLAKTIAWEDALEVWAIDRRMPLEALQQSVAVSRDASTFLADGEPMCIWGVMTTSLLTRAGIPWLLASRKLPHASRPFFLRGSRRWINEQKQKYDYLANDVGIWHGRSIRWLSWLGFDILPPRVHGVEKLMFHPVKWERV